MSAVLAPNGAQTSPFREWLKWSPVLVGLALLYVPTYYRLATWLWRSEEHGHGPLILAVAAWSLWSLRRQIFAPATSKGGAGGWVCLALGLIMYVIGRSQEIVIFEVASQIPVFLGVLLVLLGRRAAAAAWFPLFFLIFMVPMPGFLIDALTGPLKQYVSTIAEQILYWAGYPIARSGVVLSIGPYQLLVADACSGLHSMYSLGALGALYLWLMKYKSVWRNFAIAAAILPIAFAANVVRVLILVLVTYHLGDEAGQGFVHGFAGMLLFVIALVLLFAVDGLWGAVEQRAHARREGRRADV